jgi:oxygen-independent coproporphyrinogen-3 oxidase
MGSLPSPGLYVHIPFCRAKCAYCSFVSGPAPRPLRAAYLDHLAEELGRRAPRVGRPLRTVYLGGGSPSSLDDGEWRTLLELVANALDLEDVVEFTVEMNPSQVSAAKLRALRGLATRISCGVQTFEPALRETLGREPVDPSGIDRALELARGEFSLNLDLMHSIPGQTLAMLRHDCERLAGHDPDHVSAYALTIESGTPLAERIARGERRMPGDAFQAQALALVRERLQSAGYDHYEISNFARPGRECLHNLAVWAGEEYLGIGASACSYLGGERTRNEPDVAAYLERIRRDGEAVVERERLTGKRRAGELAMLALRTRAGIAIEAFTTRSGFDPLELFAGAISAHRATGLLELTPTHIRLTEAGLDLADHVIRDFI